MAEENRQSLAITGAQPTRVGHSLARIVMGLLMVKITPLLSGSFAQLRCWEWA